MMKKYLIILVLVLSGSAVFAQDSLLNYEPKVLLVTAHPDDDALFSATIFKTTKLLGGKVDLALMTNGEGGYTYSTLGNYIYNKELKHLLYVHILKKINHNAILEEVQVVLYFLIFELILN